LDREEFYRLKKVSNKKQRDSAAADAEIVAAREREAADKQAAEVEVAAAEAPDVLGENEDADVIF
jgi:V-type H+-transporting ATPase subunit D